MKKSTENNIIIWCLPITTACLVFLVCQIALMNPKIKNFYDGFWQGFFDGLVLNIPK
jgi:3-mercaptopyruvate sulfurtransferase SseA